MRDRRGPAIFRQRQRGGRVDAPVVERAPDDRAFDAVLGRRRQGFDVAERGDPTLIIGEFHKHMLGAPKPPRTTMWNDISHAVDLVRYMSGSESIEMTAFRDRRGSTWTNDYNAMIRFASGAVGIITAMRSSGGRTLRGQLHGLGVGCHFDIPERLEVYEDGDGPRMLTGAEIEGAKQGDRLAYDGTVAMHRHFAECIRDGVTPSSDVRDVINTSHLVDRLAGNE
ncbi:MAG: hypothetical protein IIC53_16105 [Proteobacteria bacterium]|nr:hypothetical protein [Pseudomonadota bacterium]